MEKQKSKQKVKEGERTSFRCHLLLMFVILPSIHSATFVVGSHALSPLCHTLPVTWATTITLGCIRWRISSGERYCLSVLPCSGMFRYTDGVKKCIHILRNEKAIVILPGVPNMCTLFKKLNYTHFNLLGFFFPFLKFIYIFCHPLYLTMLNIETEE